MSLMDILKAWLGASFWAALGFAAAAILAAGRDK